MGSVCRNGGDAVGEIKESLVGKFVVALHMHDLALFVLGGRNFELRSGIVHRLSGNMDMLCAHSSAFGRARSAH
eukprot:1095438-Pleurochrysis_carterae.AAC.1